MRVIIIGGGASGMAAAIEASGRHSVTVLERGPRLGRKLAVTGNGRCNLTNMNMCPAMLHGDGVDFTGPALSRFPAEETRRFFRGLGLVTVEEPSGRVYPHSDQAGSVVDVLRFALLERGVEVRTDFEVKTVRRLRGGGFRVISDAGELECDALIVAAGGAAGPRYGGTDLGYRLLASLGHSVTPLYPSLVQLRTENSLTRQLKGVRADAGVEAVVRDRVAAASAGEIQFTDYGLSGPAIFEVSREAARAQGCVIRLDLMREMSREELAALIAGRLGTALTVENLLTGTLHNKLGRTVLTHMGWSLAAPVRSLTADDAERIAGQIKRLELPVTGSMGMDGAQVTAGGVRVGEFRPETLESRLVPGLYACGEVLDVDGDCGGCNLQWAWSSGRLAGQLGGAG